MKSLLLLIILLFIGRLSYSQRLTTGTYSFSYCDLEYNICLGSCKVVIKKDSITVYATKELAKGLSHTKEGDVIEQGIILKHTSGKWIIGKSRKDITAERIGNEGPAIIDFKKKQYWTF